MSKCEISVEMDLLSVCFSNLLINQNLNMNRRSAAVAELTLSHSNLNGGNVYQAVVQAPDLPEQGVRVFGLN